MQKLADDLAAVERLARAGDRARLDQVDDRVGEHLGVDAQVLLVLEELDDRLGDAPDAELDGRAVVDQARRCTRRSAGSSSSGSGGWTSISGASTGTRMSRSWTWRKRVAQRARHLRVDLGDDQRGVLGGALDDVDRDAEAAHAALVRRA